jgi:hypothetical protein
LSGQVDQARHLQAGMMKQIKSEAVEMSADMLMLT